jgi:hypothetical protein
MARAVVIDTHVGDMARIAARVLTLGTVEDIEEFLRGAFEDQEAVGVGRTESGPPAAGG